MTHDAFAAGQIVTAALIDSLAAELIGSGLVCSGGLADRIEEAAENRDPNSRRVLKAFARSLRERRPPELRLITGGLDEASSGPVAGPDSAG